MKIQGKLEGMMKESRIEGLAGMLSIPLVSVVWSLSVVGGIGGKQMTT